MKPLLFVLMLAASFPAHGETWLTMGFTDHAKDKHYCETHPGVFYEWRGTLRSFVGVHQNSHCEASVVGGVAWQPLRYQRISAGAMVMALTGYENGLIVTPAPAISYDGKKYGIDVTGWPGVLWHVRWRFAF